MLELEKALHKRCETDPQYATLWAQWTFDKQLVGRALQSIPLIFPHYSLHDASHADTILRQMARVLGPRRIERLSPTDLWLLLESAYHHDLGMVVSEETMQKWWADKNFEPFLSKLKDHSDDDIRNAARILDKGSEFHATSPTWPFEVRRALVLVMAEYARPKHPGQSREYVDAPSLLDLQSPRTMLVSRRFWRLLGRICEAHGLSFRDMKKLPARESGFGVDEAHPRFIACMLRLGDLLDLDDGRFCPVLARAFGGLPPSSKAHEDKHRSIEEFFVDASEIRVVAECKMPEAFDATEQWFSWLRDELRDQSVNWSEISPEPDFGAVPSAGKIEARLLDYHTFADGRRPRFDVDKGAMLEFVQGAGLYTDETACIAELLQNAVDATLLRVWTSDKQKWKKIQDEGDDQALVNLREALREYPIDVQVKKLGQIGDENVCEVVITDQGAGIHKEDISYLQCVGSSRKNPRRVARLRGMPEWLKPAGYFGIGLQSIFLFTDKLTIRSRADDSLETIEIEFKQRPGGKPSDERQILVRTLKGNEAETKVGTRMVFVLREDAVRKRFTCDDEDRETNRVLKDYDPLVDDHLPFLASRVRDATRRFAKHTLARLQLDGNSIDPEKLSLDAADDEDATAKGEPRKRFFDPATSIELAIMACRQGKSDFFYRGRNAMLSKTWDFFNLQVSWYQSDASTILTVNREEIRPGAREHVETNIRRALLHILPRYYESIKDNPLAVQELQYLALAAEVDDDIRQMREERKLPHLEHWKQIEYKPRWRATLSPNAETLGRISDAQEIVIFSVSSWSGDITDMLLSEFSWSTDGQNLTIRTKLIEDYLWAILRERHIALRDVSSSGPRAYKEEYIVLRSPPPDVIVKDDAFKFVMKSAGSPRVSLARRTIPCRTRFLATAFSPESERLIGYHRRMHPRLFPRAISPFRIGADGRISLDGIEALVKWTYEHRLDKKTTERDIARAVIDFVQVTHSMMHEEWRDRIDYTVEELRRKFTRTYGSDVLPAAEPATGA